MKNKTFKPKVIYYGNAIVVKHLRNKSVTVMKIKNSTDVVIYFKTLVTDPKVIAEVKDNPDKLGSRTLIRDKILLTRIRLSKEALEALSYINTNLNKIK